MNGVRREDPSIIKVQDFLQMSNVRIPDYQRPYKWTSRNVNALLDDVLANHDRSAYRLGTLVFHNDGEFYNIVDGQQRSTTLTLLAMAINKDERLSTILRKIWPMVPREFSLSSQEYDCSVSRDNVWRNYFAIKERLVEFNERSVEFLLHRCEFVKVVLDDESEAFQFFDSQNSRGKDLEPHDLLKAYHLREMRNESQVSVHEAVSCWEGIQTKELSCLFGDWLFHVRNWSSLKSACKFTKDDVGIFKGINPEDVRGYPYQQIYRTAHFCAKEFNRSAYRHILQKKMEFPFQLDQVVVNGRRFFEMVDYYNKKRRDLADKLKSFDQQLGDILTALAKYEGRNRDGDGYVRNLFECACLYFLDKFGDVKEFPLVVRRLFFWAYYLRLSYARLSQYSVDNYARRGDGMMLRIRHAMSPAELVSKASPYVVDKIRSTRTEMLADIFRSAGLVK